MTINAWNTPDLTTDGQLLIGNTGNRPLANVPVGDTSEISITPGSGTINIGIADNPIFPGVASATLPIGTTAQRPGAPVEGMTRYNSDEDIVEAYANGGWRIVEKDDAVLASLGATISNVTGDGTVYTIVFPSTIYNTRTSYNTTTGQLEPAQQGIYLAGGSLTLLGIGAGHTDLVLQCTSVPAAFVRRLVRLNPAAIAVGGELTINFNIAIQTVISGGELAFQLQVSGSTLTVSLEGNPGTGRTTYWASYASNL